MSVAIFAHRKAAITIPRVLERAISVMHEAVMVFSGTPGPDSLRVRYVNAAFTRMTGYSYGEIVGLMPEILWGQLSDRATLTHAARELRSGRSFEGRVISYRKNRYPFLLDAYVEPLGDGEGGQELFLMVMRDVTEESPQDAAMRHIVAALDHVDDGIVVLSTTRQVQYINQAANEFFGDDTSVHVPLPLHAWGQLEQGLDWSGQIEVMSDPGRRRLTIHVKQVLSFDGEPGWLLVANDITDVERLRSIADSVNLSENLGHFMSGIRHELGNPVNSIKTALTVLHSNLGTFPPEKVADYVRRVLGEVGRIEFLLRSLRSFSLHESVVLTRVEVPEVVREIIALVRPSIKPGVTLLIDTPPAVSVIADVRALYQILLNLFSNALEAQPHPKDTIIRLETTVGAEHVEIAVVDNGPGMSCEQLELAQRPFFTTKQSGTGLGLAIAQRLAANQGGRLRLTSKPGKGTRAIVSLALAPHRSEGS